MTDLRFALRPYQVDALDKTDEAEGRGIRRQLGVAATGLGKTIMFCSLAERRGGRALILAHRDELVSQAVAKVQEVWPGVDVGVVKADRNQCCAHVVVASVQTLSRQRRLDQMLTAIMDPDGCAPFDLVVVDEAHHTAADTYRRILAALHVGEEGGPLLLGVTATPDRGDGKGLDDLFDEIVWSYDLLWGIRSGYLSDVRGKRVTVEELDLTNVKVTRGDFDAGAAGRAMEDANSPDVIVDAWLEHARDRRTLCFTPTVALAEAVADAFRHAGVKAEFVSGETPLEDRRAILRAYARGDVEVLANCAVLTEGYDEPRTDCIIVARPTKSRALYTQMVGRGTRRHPDKTDLLVLDIVGATEMHSLVTVPSLFGLGDGFDKRMENEGAAGLVEEWQQLQIRVGAIRAEDVEMFAAVRGAGIAWAAVHEPGDLRRYVKSLGRDDDGVILPTVVLAQRDEELWTAGLSMSDGTKVALMGARLVSLEVAQGIAEDYIRATLKTTHLIDPDAPWRKRRPTERQLWAAKRWKMRVDPAWSAGELSDALDAHIDRRKRGA